MFETAADERGVPAALVEPGASDRLALCVTVGLSWVGFTR